MATTLTIDPTNQTNQPGVITMYGINDASGSYSTGGDTMSCAIANFPSSEPPLWVEFQGQAAGYTYQWIPATSPTLASPGKFKVIDLSTAPPVELAAGAYPAAVANDTIRVRIVAKNR